MCVRTSAYGCVRVPLRACVCLRVRVPVRTGACVSVRVRAYPYVCVCACMRCSTFLVVVIFLTLEIYMKENIKRKILTQSSINKVAIHFFFFLEFFLNKGKMVYKLLFSHRVVNIFHGCHSPTFPSMTTAFHRLSFVFNWS